MKRAQTAPDLAEGELDILEQLAAAAAACREPNVHRTVLLSLARRGYLQFDHFSLSNKALDALAREGSQPAPLVPKGYRLVPIEPPHSLAPLLTAYSLDERHGMSERDRTAVIERLRARWSAILASLDSDGASVTEAGA